MQTDILKPFSNLQYELEEAKNCLKCVDESIKKIIGRDPSELPPKLNKKRLPPINDEGRAGLKLMNRIRNISYETDAPANKRRNNDSVFKRLSTSAGLEDVHHDIQKQMISKVIVTSKDVPSREEALEAQNKDEKFRARNKRMFGALLGTLQKFQQEETKLKPREEKRAQLERKIEEHEIKEKEDIKKERHELFLSRKKKQIEIKVIELKMSKMREYTAWEEYQKPRGNFILTKTHPQIHYLPRRLNNKSKDLLNATKQDIQTTIENKSLQILEELKHIEDKMTRNFSNKYGQKTIKQNEKPSNDINDDHHLEETTEGVVCEEEKLVHDDVKTIDTMPLEQVSLEKTTDDDGSVQIQDKENNHLISSGEVEPETNPLDNDAEKSNIDNSIYDNVI